MPGPSTNSQPPASSAGNVYHKAERVPRSRVDPVHKLDSAGTLADRRIPDPARAVTLRNLRRFALFTVGMLIVVFISIRLLMWIWAMKDRENQRTDPVATVPVDNQVEQPDKNPTPQQNPTSPGPRKTEDLDVEAIRKAVFLAKRAKALAQGGSYDEAIARYKDALEVWPYLTQVWAELGRLYLQTRDYNKAQIALEKAVENDPGSPEILNDLAVAGLYLGQTDKAIKLLDTVIEISPQFASAYFNIALCHLSKSDRKGAREYFDRFLRLKPDDPRALREKAYLDAIEHRYPEALDALEKAIIELPDWALLYFDAGATAALMGRADDAIHFLERALPLSNPAAVYRLYQEPAFKEIRLSEIGREFEKNIAGRVREAMEKNTPDTAPPATTQPILSTQPDAVAPTP